MIVSCYSPDLWNFELAHAGIEEVAEPRFESRPGMEYKLREDGVQSRGFSWLQASEGNSKLFRPERFGDTVTSGVGIFHRSDSFLLMSVVGSWSLVLCAPFFTKCEAMEFAETGHW